MVAKLSTPNSPRQKKTPAPRIPWACEALQRGGDLALPDSLPSFLYRHNVFPTLPGNLP